jgi:asparagine synthase (glutamine-hydrolysing)
MCGIAGIASRAEVPALVPAVERMVKALVHRGPDDQGLENLGSCVLGNTRLAIVDLSERGHMPMCNEDATVWITYNGECYNAKELRPLLESRGHEFKSTTDTEVILHLYEEFGERCVEKLRGMFAFAIWDDRQGKLLLARDRLGIKPLYFLSLGNGGILFASEIKALLASEIVDRRADPRGIRAFLQLGHIPWPWTAIKDVTPLEPGHTGVWQDGQFHTKAYWRLPQPGNGLPPAPRERIVPRVREILLESSRLHLMSDVPIALFLSGGIDSAALASFLRAVGADQLTALTIGFAEAQFDESESSRETAQLLGIPHRLLRLDPVSVANSLDNAIWAMDQPSVDGLNAYWISRVASEAGFKVTLSGQGGDELFGGYESLGWFDRFTHVAGWLRPFPESTGRYLFDYEVLPFRWRKLSYLVGADDPFVAAQMAVRVLFPDRDTRKLLNPQMALAEDELEAASFITEIASETKGLGVLDRIAFLDFVAHLECRLLRDGDAMSMAHSLEVRPVFLDHALVEYVMTLPASLRLQKKKLLLAASRDLMPPGLFEALAARPKRTFTFPFARWLGQDLRPSMEAGLHSERTAALLNAPAVLKLWRRYLANPSSIGWTRIWSVFVLTRWCETMGVGV